MPSSKLSGRKATAKKPSICISLTGPWNWQTDKIELTVILIQNFEPPPLIGVWDTVTLRQNPDDESMFGWSRPAYLPNKLKAAVLITQWDPTFNKLNFTACDQYADPHLFQRLFQPARPVPFSQDTTANSPDYPNLDTNKIQFRPFKK